MDVEGSGRIRWGPKSTSVEDATIIHYVEGHGYTYLPLYSPGKESGSPGPLYDQLPPCTPIAHPLHNHWNPGRPGFSSEATTRSAMVETLETILIWCGKPRTTASRALFASI